jgi:hypothetical protein
MNPQLMFSIGNVVADACIAAFAAITWFHENESRRFFRLVSLLLQEGSVSNLQAAVIEAWVFSGRQQDLQESAQKYGLGSDDCEKLRRITGSLQRMRKVTFWVLIGFIVGILIQIYAVCLGW